MSNKTRRLFTLGAFSLVAGILLGRFAPDAGTYHFLEGMFLGLSMTVNLGALILWRREKAVIHSRS